MHDGQHGARASACVGREQRRQLDVVEPERGRELRAETVGGVESELRLARETGSRRNLQRSRAKAVHERSRAVQLRADGPAAPRRCGTIQRGRPRPDTTEKRMPDALGRPRHERAVANLLEVAEPFCESVLDSLEGQAERLLRRWGADAREAIRVGCLRAVRHAASWRSISATSSSGLRAWISSAGASSRSVRSGRGRTFPPSRTSFAPALSL